MQEKIWIYKEIDEQEADKLATTAGVSGLIAKVFISRGITDSAYVMSFMRPSIDGLHDPSLMDGMEKACECIIKALENKKSILIYGDYDVDGVTSTSILYSFLLSKGGRVSYYIPDRMEDGYGLTMSTVEKIRQLNVDLVITADCGITSVDEVKALQDYGMQVIVTDHHECKEKLPIASAVMNPHKPGCTYPFKELCGAGVILKLIQAMCIKMGCDQEYLKYMDLAALATIADVVPLVGENRIIVSYGLKAMETTTNYGLKALISVAGLGGKPVTSYSAAFALAPRINAGGRLGDASRGVQLFTAESLVFAEAFAKELDEENRKRQETENDILNEAITFVEEKLDPVKEKVLVISGEAWHQGVIGIVASKILEKYNRPCIVISVENGIGKGSGRSIKGFNLFNALTQCEDLLEKFGGHEMAAGITIAGDRIEEFRKRINAYADTVLTDSDMLPYISIDAFLESDDITFDSVSELEMLAPYGAGNPSPVFGYTALSAADIRTLSGGKHLKLKMQDGEQVFDAIGFNMGNISDELKETSVVDAAFTLEINSFNGTDRLQMNLKDIKPCIYTVLDKNIVFEAINDYNRCEKFLQELDHLKGHYNVGLKELIPTRCDYEAVYRYIMACERQLRQRDGVARNEAPKAEKRLKFADLFFASAVVSKRFNVRMNYFKVKRVLDVFQELGLLRNEPLGVKGACVTLPDTKNKVELEASKLYMELQSLIQHRI